MGRFDSELYLRILGERTLLDGSGAGHRGSTPLGEAAGALVAAQAITEGAADTVLDEYGLAGGLREGGRHFQMRRAHRRSAAGRSPVPAPLPPSRLVACDRVIERSDGVMHVRYVKLGAQATTLAVSIRRPSPTGGRGLMNPALRQRMLMGPRGPGGLPSVTLGDDRGTSSGAHFSGGGGGGHWTGRLNAARPLAVDTEWIEVDGVRIELEGDPVGAEVSVESLPQEDPVLRHLWRRVAASSRFHGPEAGVERAIEALLASGVLAASEPALADVCAVLACLRAPGAAGGGRPLPEPWHSLLARAGAPDGGEGLLVVGAGTPVFEGISVAVDCLEVGEGGFSAHVEVVPGTHHGPLSGGRVGGAGELVWWARDDRGNPYLGQIAGWSSSDNRSEGDIAFWPALDPEARSLDLLPTAERMRAVIRVPLRG